MDIDPTDAGCGFALALIRAAILLNNLADDVVDELRRDADPDEKPGVAFIEMLCWAIGSAIGDAAPHDVRRATELIAAACEGVVEHLRIAVERSWRMRADGDGGGGRGRAYG